MSQNSNNKVSINKEEFLKTTIVIFILSFFLALIVTMYITPTYFVGVEFRMVGEGYTTGVPVPYLVYDYIMPLFYTNLLSWIIAFFSVGLTFQFLGLTIKKMKTA